MNIRAAAIPCKGDGGIQNLNGRNATAGSWIAGDGFTGADFIGENAVVRAWTATGSSSLGQSRISPSDAVGSNGGISVSGGSVGYSARTVSGIG